MNWFLTLESGKQIEVFEGQDVSSLLGVEKWSPPIPVCMAGEVYNAGTHIGVNYDIENIKKFTSIFSEGEEVQVTEKIHGCVHPDTNIMLPNGEEIAIKHIIDDDRYTHVLSFDVATHQFVSKPITGKLRRPNIENKRWMKMVLEHNRVLRITEDHPIFSEDRNDYFPAKEIQPGENIKSPI